jgi:membrane-associated protein
MEFLHSLIDLFIHLDRHLGDTIAAYGAWTYLILFVIIFAETGLVFTPFLPGDSLIFAAGVLSGGGALNPWVLFILMSTAAIVGDTVNYWIGKYFGAYMTRRFPRVVRPEYLEKTHAFFERYGGKTIIIARFVPIVRTFAPFVAGCGAMTYNKFLLYNIVGGVLWVALCLLAGFWLGSIPVVREHFSLVVLAIVLISILPMVVSLWNARRASRRVVPQAVQDALPSGSTGSASAADAHSTR